MNDKKTVQWGPSFMHIGTKNVSCGSLLRTKRVLRKKTPLPEKPQRWFFDL